MLPGDEARVAPVWRPSAVGFGQARIAHSGTAARSRRGGGRRAASEAVLIERPPCPRANHGDDAKRRPGAVSKHTSTTFVRVDAAVRRAHRWYSTTLRCVSAQFSDVTEVAMFKAVVDNPYNWNRSLDAGGAAGL